MAAAGSAGSVPTWGEELPSTAAQPRVVFQSDPTSERPRGWALVRQEFLAKSKSDAVLELWQAAARDYRDVTREAKSPATGAATSQAMTELRKTRSKRGSTFVEMAMRRLKRVQDPSPGSSPGNSRPGSPKQSKPLINLLQRDTRHHVKQDCGFFGSIRFEAAPRALPSKFMRLASSHNFFDHEEAMHYARHVVDLAIHTWRLAPPCAMISVTDAGPHCDMPLNSRIELVLRRGIANAASQTSAWIFTNGSAADAGARTVGRAMLYLSNECAEPYPNPSWPQP